MRRIFGYFLQGLLLVIPTVLLAYVVYRLFEFLDALIPMDVPGLGLLVLLVGITILGFLGSSFIGRPILNRANALLDRIPLIKTFYTAVSDLLSAFTGQKKSFSKPVLVNLTPDGHVQKPGFITSEDLSMLGIAEGKVAVYLPHSYNFSGNIFIVPAGSVIPLPDGVNRAEFMKFIVSGGVTEIGSSHHDG